MAKEGHIKRSAPARTIEDREKQIAAYAYDEAERQIIEGKASSQVLTHFLKIGSTRARIEEEKIKHENALMEAKIKNIETIEETKKMYADAMEAMKSYSGHL